MSHLRLVTKTEAPASPSLISWDSAFRRALASTPAAGFFVDRKFIEDALRDFDEAREVARLLQGDVARDGKG